MIQRKTAAEFLVDLNNAILSRNSTYDTQVGPVPDLVTIPLSNVLELQNERILSVQQLLSLTNDGTFESSDIDQFVYNEAMLRLDGSIATVTLIFSRATVPTADITVRANFPVATLSDESGASVTFITTADATLYAASATAYFNSTTQRYELSVTAQAVMSAEMGNVGPNRVTRPLRPLVGFDNVFNRDAAVGGADTEIDDDLISRYYISLAGTSPGISYGIKKIIRDLYSSVYDSYIVFGNDILNVRGATDSGAVDVYVIGSTSNTVIETVVFVGVNQVIPLTNRPVVSVTSVGAYVVGTDYEFVQDTTSGYAHSTRSADGIRFLPGGAAPAVGGTVAVTYTQNSLMSTLQTGFIAEDMVQPGRDILFKAATQIDITISANLKVRAGYTPTTVLSTVRTAILDYINALKLGDDIENSDIQGVVRAFTSVDNFVITNLAEVGLTGTADMLISVSEYARLDTADLLITLI